MIFTTPKLFFQKVLLLIFLLLSISTVDGQASLAKAKNAIGAVLVLCKKPDVKDIPSVQNLKDRLTTLQTTLKGNDNEAKKAQITAAMPDIEFVKGEVDLPTTSKIPENLVMLKHNLTNLAVDLDKPAKAREELKKEKEKEDAIKAMETKKQEEASIKKTPIPLKPIEKAESINIWLVCAIIFFALGFLVMMIWGYFYFKRQQNIIEELRKKQDDLNKMMMR